MILLLVSCGGAHALVGDLFRRRGELEKGCLCISEEHDKMQMRKFWWRQAVSVVLAVVGVQAVAELRSQSVVYEAGERKMVGHLVWDDRYDGKRPGVLVVHEWWGLNDYIRHRARQLALMGYTALAVDMYGDAAVTTHPQEAEKFANAIGSNAPLIRERFEAAMKALKNHETVDERPLSAIGYCLGGGIVLNVARMGLELRGVASFHGALGSLVRMEDKPQAKIMVFTGAEDRLVPPNKVSNFKDEMDAVGADYQVYSYPGAVHGFTNPEATRIGKKLGFSNLRYNRHADTDSWSKLNQFLSDLYK